MPEGTSLPLKVRMATNILEACLCKTLALMESWVHLDPEGSSEPRQTSNLTDTSLLAKEHFFSIILIVFASVSCTTRAIRPERKKVMLEIQVFLFKMIFSDFHFCCIVDATIEGGSSLK